MFFSFQPSPPSSSLCSTDSKSAFQVTTSQSPSSLPPLSTPQSSPHLFSLHNHDDPSLTERGAEARLSSLPATGIALPGKSEPDQPPRFSPPRFSPSPGEHQKATKFTPAPTKSSEPLGEPEKAPGQPSRSAQYREPCQRDQQRSERGFKV